MIRWIAISAIAVGAFIAGLLIGSALSDPDVEGDLTVAPVETNEVRMLELPPQSATPDSDTQYTNLADNLGRTILSVEYPNDVDLTPGNPDAGGHASRATEIPVSAPQASSADSEATDREPAPATPMTVLTDAPSVFPYLDLGEIIIADPIGDVRIDICAGPAEVPETPEGCPSGFGGTITTFDADAPEPIALVGGRPPTGMTAFGVDSLYVRAFRRSDVREEIRVQARPLNPTESEQSVCDTAGEIASTSDEPESGAQGINTLTIPIDIDSTWPYDESYDTLEVFYLRLEPDRRYAICVYWIDLEGPTTVVSISESATILTPATEGLVVKVEGLRINGRDTSEQIGSVSVTMGRRFGDPYCSPVSWPWDAPGETFVFDPAVPICDDNHIGSIGINGGFQLWTALVGIFERGVEVSWIPFDPREPAGSTRIAVPLASVDHTPPSDSGRDHYPAGYLDVVIVRTAGTGGGYTGSPVEAWYLGEVEEFDDTNPALNAQPLFVLRNRDPGVLHMIGAEHAVRQTYEVIADRPVTLSVRFTADPLTGEPPCLIGPTPAEPVFATVELSERHTFIVDGMCLGDRIPIEIDAADATGTPAVSTFLFYPSSPTFHVLQTYGFGVSVSASINVGPVPTDVCGGRGICLVTLDYVIGDANDSGISRGSDGAYPAAPVSGGPYFPWMISVDPTDEMCEGAPEEPSPPAVATDDLWFPSGSSHNWRFSTQIVAGERAGPASGLFPNPCRGLGPFNINSVEQPLENTVWDVSGIVSLQQLIEGVTISPVDADYPQLHLQATSVNEYGALPPR